MQLADRVEAAGGPDVAAEDDEVLTGDVGRPRRGQEPDQVGDVAGVPFVEGAVLLLGILSVVLIAIAESRKP